MYVSNIYTNCIKREIVYYLIIYLLPILHFSSLILHLVVVHLINDLVIIESSLSNSWEEKS